jgi:hypothetical protein
MATLPMPPVRTVQFPPKFHVIPEFAGMQNASVQPKPNVDRSGDDKPGNTNILVYTCSVRRREERAGDS